MKIYRSQLHHIRTIPSCCRTYSGGLSLPSQGYWNFFARGWKGFAFRRALPHQQLIWLFAWDLATKLAPGGYPRRLVRGHRRALVSREGASRSNSKRWDTQILTFWKFRTSLFGMRSTCVGYRACGSYLRFIDEQLNIFLCALWVYGSYWKV